MITKTLSGHMYVGSAIESSSDCGNCDGARCDHCHARWEFEGERFSSYEAALSAKAEAVDIWETLVPGVEKPPHQQFALNADGELAALLWSWEKRDHLVACNTDSPAYDALYAKALKATELWVKCPCVDKADNCYANDCSIMGCNDSRCQYEVKHKGRKERKWYM
jgi:hypothetical protein